MNADSICRPWQIDPERLRDAHFGHAGCALVAQAVVRICQNAGTWGALLSIDDLLKHGVGSWWGLDCGDDSFVERVNGLAWRVTARFVQVCAENALRPPPSGPGSRTSVLPLVGFPVDWEDYRF